MEIEPLKIPAFMRKKAFVSKDSAHFLKPSPVPSSSAPSTPARPRNRFVSSNPAPAPSVPARSQRRITFSTLAPAPSTPLAPHYTKPEPVFSIPLAPRIIKPAKYEPVYTPVGAVTYYLDKIKVVIVKLDADVRVGDRLVLNGEKGPFRQKISSMQIDRQNVEAAGRGKEVGIKVSKKAIVGEMVYVIG